MAYIELKNVSYQYPLTSKPSIENVNLKLAKGKVFALIGPNGAGKTTLCNILRGFIPKFFQGDLQGEVIIDSVDISNNTLGELAPKVGYVFQNPFNQITGARDNVYEEIAYGLEKFGVEISQIEKRVERVMELTNTKYLKDKNPFQLSGGQQQRVALASIIVLEPDILVIDEPTSQLDPKETERVFDIIEKLKVMGKTIILVEHKIELIAKHADEVIVIDDGRIVKFGEKHDVLSDLSLLDHNVQLPQSVILKEELRKNGIEIEGNPITREELETILLNDILKKEGL